MKTRAPNQKQQNTARSMTPPAPLAHRWSRYAQLADETGSDAHRPDELRALSRRNLRSLQLFLLVSCAAFLLRDVDLYASLPEGVLVVLGCPPPAMLAHCAFAGYLFTVLTPLAIHLLNGDRPVVQWRHLGYRSAFYAFYLFSATLAANFSVVFTVGIGLYLLEQLGIGLAIARDSQAWGRTA